MAFITIAGQNQIAKKQGNNATLNISKFVMANVPNLGDEPATRIESIPNAYVVDQLNVTKSGYVNTNQVVYSLVMGSNVGDYQFNWVGLVDDEGVLIAVTYIPLTAKTKNNGGVPGNTFTRNFLLSYTGIQQTTAVNVPAETWQIDFSDRLGGIDERERLSNLDIYGHEGFLADGWKVTGANGTYSVAAGIGYVGGVRAKNTAPQQITTTTFPNEIWLNVSLQGDISDMTAVCEFVIDKGPFADYVDSNGVERYLTRIATIASNKSVTDSRVIYDPRNASNLNAGTVPLARLPVTSNATDDGQDKLLKVGDFGLGGGGLYGVFGIDLDNYIKTGVYRNASHNTWNNSLNKPDAITTSNQTFVLTVDVNQSLAVTQTLHVESNRYFIRSRDIYGVWGPWREMYHSGNLTKATSAAVLAGTNDTSFVTPKSLKAAGIVPTVGMIVPFPTLSTPVGFLKLQDGELSRSSYSLLFSFAISSGNMAASEAAKEPGQFGPGNGTTTFTLPNPQGYVIRALDESGSIDPNRQMGSAQDDSVQSHRHDVSGGEVGSQDEEATVKNVLPTFTLVDDGTETRMKNVAWPLYIKY
jgi:hypothetical protein